MEDEGLENGRRRELMDVCGKIKRSGGLRFPTSLLNRISDFGGAPRRHQILIDYLKKEGIDVTKAKSVAFGFSERKDVYKALGELVSRDRFADVFLRIELLNSLSKRPKVSRFRLLEERLKPEQLSTLRDRSARIQSLLKAEFLTVFEHEVQPEFRNEPVGEPEVYCHERFYRGKLYFVVTFDFPRERRLSKWKHTKDTLHVPDYVTVWIGLEDGTITVSESSLNHRIFPHLEAILMDVFGLPAFDVVKHSLESPEVTKVIEDGVSGVRPICYVELVGKDDRKIQKIIISGESVLEKLREAIGEDALEKILRLFDLRYVQGDKEYVIE